MRSPRLKASRHLTGCALLLASAGFADARAATGNRIAEALDSRSSLVLRDSAHPQAQVRYEAGRVGGDTVLQGVSLYFALSPGQQADLDELLRQQQDPLSPNYHQWLTPQQYASRFGLSAADRDRITAWLRGQGFSIDSVSASGNRVSFSGSVARIESAFQTELHRYQVDGESHFANATNLSVPAALSGMVLGVRGLDDFRPKPRFRAAPRFTSSISGNHFLTPDDFATIYNLKPLYSAGITGSNRKIAVVGQSQVYLSDIRAFRSAAGLTAKDPVLTQVPGNTVPLTNGSDDMAESDIDIEWSGGVAQDATIDFIYAPNVFDAVIYAVENNVAPVISISYGICETGNTSTIKTQQDFLARANAQGQTIVTSSGDAGAADCSTTGDPTASGGLVVDFPASSPNVTGVGGTEFNDGDGTGFWSASNNAGNGSALSYIPEVAWNDTGKKDSKGNTIGLSASGGGKSTYASFTKPAWQTGAGVPGDNARFVPDIALSASSLHVPYLYCTTNSSGQGTCSNGTFRFSSSDPNTNNTLTAAGGTSFGAPAFAGMLTLVAQKSGASSGLGNVNPQLYQLAASTTGVFHDITSGNNMVPTSTGGSIGYNAGVGYDPVTGLGSVDGNNLADAWASSSSSSSSSGGASSSSGSSSSSSSSGGGGGGGGGAAAPGVLALLASLLLLRRSRQST